MYLLAGRLFLKQYIKIPITRSIRTTEPAASDTMKSNRPVSEIRKQKQPKMILVEDEHRTGRLISQEKKLY